MTDPITRAKEAMAAALTVMGFAFNRIHGLPRTRDTELAESIEKTMAKVRAALTVLKSTSSAPVGPVDVARLRELMAKATATPWVQKGTSIASGNHRHALWLFKAVYANEADAALIVAAINSLPSLLAAYERQEAGMDDATVKRVARAILTALKAERDEAIRQIEHPATGWRARVEGAEADAMLEHEANMSWYMRAIDEQLRAEAAEAEVERLRAATSAAPPQPAQPQR